LKSKIALKGELTELSLEFNTFVKRSQDI